jgi:hypothetical protein
MTKSDTPSKSDLGTRLAVFLANLNKHGFVHEFAHILSTVVYFVLIAKRAVLGNMNTFGFVEFAKRVLLEPWMKL